MSTTISSLSSCNSSLLHIRTRRSSYRPSSLDVSGGLVSQSGTCHFLGNPKLQLLYSTSFQIVQNGSKNTKMDMKVNSDILPDGSQLPSNNDPGSWKLWLVGVIMSVIIPFWKNKWGPLQKLQQKVEQVVDTAQAVTDVVEDVVEEVEKVADELGNKLPKGKLQEVASFVEDLANEAGEHIDRFEEVLDKVEEVENKVEDFIDEQTEEGKNDENKTQTKEEKSVKSA